MLQGCFSRTINSYALALAFVHGTLALNAPNTAIANPDNLRTREDCYNLPSTGDANQDLRARNRCLRNVDIHNGNAHMNQGYNDPGSYGAPYADQLVVERDGVNQLEKQEDAFENKSAGSGAANQLGMMLGATGAGMIMTGIGMNASSKCGCAGNPMIAAGKYFLAGAAGAMLTSMVMGQNAGTNADYGSNLDDLSNFDGNLITPVDPGITPPNSDNPGFNVDPGNSNSPGLAGGGGGSDGNANFTGATQGVAAAFKVDSESLRNNAALSKGVEALEKAGIDPEEFANSIANGGNVGELLAAGGLVADADSFNKKIDEEKIDQDKLMSDFKEGKFDEFGNLIEGAEGVTGAEFAGGGEGIQQGETEGDEDAQSDNFNLEKPKTYDELLAEMMKNGGKGGPKSLKDILGISGKGKKKKSAALSGKGELKGVRGLASVKKEKFAFIDAVNGNGDYVEKTIFQRVHLVYKLRREELLPTDWYLRNRVR